jgi:hypothetical protein
MRVYARTFRLPKAGNSPEEYEDAAWPHDGVQQEGARFRCAIADGATETSFSGLWARILVEAFGKGRISNSSLTRVLPTLSDRWTLSTSSATLPWYAEAKLQSGAYASLVGLTLYQRKQGDPSNGWSAEAVGDGCLFHIHGETLALAFPLQESRDFTSRPRLLSTAAGRDVHGSTNRMRCKGTWEPGDRFYLMTDALACWFLHALETGEKASETVDSLALYSDMQDFASWIGDLRRAGDLKNDDVTLVHVEVF